MRRGRRCDTTKLSTKLLYILYSVVGWKWAYRRFNAPNRYDHDNAKRSYIPSIVVQAGDTPEMIADYIRRMPDGTAVALMLHSILSPDHPQCGKDPWSWSAVKFDKLCAALNLLAQQGIITTAPLAEQLKG